MEYTQTGNELYMFLVEVPMPTEGLVYVYNPATDSYKVVWYEGSSVDVLIASSYNDCTNGEKPVTIIGSGAFNGMAPFPGFSSYNSITIPDSIIKIEDSAFEYITIQNFKIGANVSDIYTLNPGVFGGASFVNLIIDSETVSSGIDDGSYVMGGILDNQRATNVYIKSGLAVNSWLTDHILTGYLTDWKYVLVTSDMTGYDKYTRQQI